MSPDTTHPAGNVPRPSPTRDRILDAFAHLLIDQGERAATLDAVAAAAGLSKGGLLYHFGSKDALVEGLLARLDALVVDDIEQIRAAPAGAIDYLIRTSMSEGTSLDQSIGAAVRLAQGAHPLANAALASTRRQWLSVIEEAVGDPDVAEVIMLVSDGLYYESTL
ncbi:MAG TPA: TetR/AcrR family transcriptional regulator, partial [Cryobacterium sp.]|nr:TetR/AcrR family transcriptional regulator [Cryobacterium sp.]